MSGYLIGLHGLAGVGKDTAGQYLAEQGFATYALAGPIKAGLCAMFEPLGLTPEHFTDRALKEQPLADIWTSPRRLAQTLGTEWGRAHIHPDLWIILAEHALEDAFKRGLRGLVITDVRFANESDWIHRCGGEVWQIHRSTAAVAAHSSEAGLPAARIDRHILNDGGFDGLYGQIDAALAAAEKVA